MIKYWCKTVLIIIFSFTNLDGYTQDIPLSSSLKLPYNITPSIEVFRDSSTKLTLTQVATKNFEKPNKDHFIFPYSNDIFWVRFTLKNTDTANKDWLLVWSNPLVEQLDFYISDSTSKTFSHTQQKLITNPRDKKLIDQDPKFSFELSPRQTKTIYIKLSCKRGHYGSLILYSNMTFYENRLEEYATQSFRNGLVIFRLFLVLILSIFIIKDLAFRLYSFHTVLKTFAYWGIINIAGPLFTNNPDWAKKINFLCYNSVTIGSVLFVLVTLTINKLPKWHSWLMYGIIAFTIFTDVMVFIDYQWYWLKAGLYTIVFTSTYIICLYIYCMIKRIPINIYYAIPFILGIFSYFLINIRLLEWLEYKPIYSIASLFFVAEIFVFVIFLGRIFRNIERNKLLAEQKLHFNEVQNERLKELDNIKTTFFTNISHEFRTPLSLILGPIDDLKNKYPSESLFEPMKRNAKRLLVLINQLLDLSKLDSGQMQVNIQNNDLANYIKVLASSFSSLAESRKIAFEISQNRTEAIAYFDADKIEKILTNLLSNAFKFTPNLGQISLIVTYSDNFSEVEIAVKDSGIGISAKKITQIFDRFFQVDGTHQRGYEGSGIGLALVKEMVALHKGSIVVESTEGEGTTFRVKLPINKSSWANELKNSATKETNHTPSDVIVQTQDIPTIAIEQKLQSDEENILLIVEDNADLRKYIRSIFEPNYLIIEAIDGQEGIEKALEFIPDIVVSDLMMPRLDGFGFCKLLKSDEKTNHIPVIMLTAKANIESRIEGFELGADDYLTKPFNKEEILVRVKNLISQRTLLRQKFDKQVVDLKPSEVKVSSIEEKFIIKAKAIIEKHLAESEFDVEQFAKEMNMTSVILRRKLKAVVGKTVTEFVRSYRLQRAAELLSKRTGSVSEIAYQVGFESLSYFTKVFQEEFSINPSDFSPFKNHEN